MVRLPAPVRFVRRPVWLHAVVHLCLGACVVGCFSACLAGCNKVSPDNIQLWKTTEKGPGKLNEALGDRSVDPTLRAEAAVALVDIGRSDEVETNLGALPAAERWDILKALIPLDVARMNDPAPEKALAFRDALFSLRAWAQPEDQARIDAALLPVIAADLRTGHVRNGRHSIEKILTAMGSSAGATLANLLAEPIPATAAVADLLAKVGDEASREKAGVSLVARAERLHPIPEAMWKSIGAVGGPAATKFLEDKVVGPNHDDALGAVRGLQQRRDPSVLGFALKIAGDSKADRAIRDEMFGVVEAVGGLEARDGLVRIIQTDKDEVVRYRAFESLLTVAKQDGVRRGLEAFPAGVGYKKVDVEDLLVKLIEKLGQPVRPILVETLESTSPLARMTAVMTLESLGKSADAGAIDKLGNDGAVVKGFPVDSTIGKEATRAAVVARSRS